MIPLGYFCSNLSILGRLEVCLTCLNLRCCWCRHCWTGVIYLSIPPSIHIPNHIFSICSSSLQVFVETLDRCFENVCELDLIFHVDKVHYILQEIVMGGMVLETNMNEVIQRIEDQNKLEKVKRFMNII